MKLDQFFWLQPGIEDIYEELLENANKLHRHILDPLLEDDGYEPIKTYLITETALKVIDRIKMDKIDFKLLADVPVGKYESLQQRNKDKKHIWLRHGEWIYGALLTVDATMIKYFSYRINVASGYLSDSADYSR